MHSFAASSSVDDKPDKCSTSSDALWQDAAASSKFKKLEYFVLFSNDFLNRVSSSISLSLNEWFRMNSLNTPLALGRLDKYSMKLTSPTVSLATYLTRNSPAASSLAFSRDPAE